MAIKIATENSTITVNTFVDAPETANLDIKIGDRTTVNADTMLKISSVDSFYTKLGVPSDSITREQLVALMERVISLDEEGKMANKDMLMEWANRSAIFATLASSGPLIAAASAVAAFASLGKDGLAKLKTLIKG